MSLKCRKCRIELVNNHKIIDSHGIEFENILYPSCLKEDTTVWYIKDDELAQWLHTQVDQGQWIKGKLFCPKCNLRIGSYNFVNETLCPCGSRPLPAIHIAKSKVDFEDLEKKKELAEKLASLRVGQWIKGKLFCPKCNLRIGSYNFVNETLCPCGSRPLPAIHIAKSKVDFEDLEKKKELAEKLASLRVVSSVIPKEILKEEPFQDTSTI